MMAWILMGVVTLLVWGAFLPLLMTAARAVITGERMTLSGWRAGAFPVAAQLGRGGALVVALLCAAVVAAPPYCVIDALLHAPTAEDRACEEARREAFARWYAYRDEVQRRGSASDPRVVAIDAVVTAYTPEADPTRALRLAVAVPADTSAAYRRALDQSHLTATICAAR